MTLNPVPFGEPVEDQANSPFHLVDPDDELVTPLWKAYVGGRVACHFHFVVHVRGESASHNLCADFQLLLMQPGVLEANGGIGDVVQLPALEGDERGGNKEWVEHSVFVPVGVPPENVEVIGNSTNLRNSSVGGRPK